MKFNYVIEDSDIPAMHQLVQLRNSVSFRACAQDLRLQGFYYSRRMTAATLGISTRSASGATALRGRGLVVEIRGVSGLYACRPQYHDSKASVN